jgi:hypothetical protein
MLWNKSKNIWEEPKFFLAGQNLKVHMTQIFCWNWFSIKNPSGLLVNCLQFFWIWFVIRGGGGTVLLTFPAFYVFLVHVQICSAYSQCMNRFTRMLSKGIVSFCLFHEYAQHKSAERLIASHLFSSITTDLFLTFLVYIQINSTY